jgi:hypothetical protein
VGPDYNDTINIEKERTYVYVGDEFGYLKIWDLQALIESTGIKKCKKHTDSKAFNPRRQEVVDCSSYTNQQRTTSKLRDLKLPESIDPSMTGVLIREAKGHTDVITCVSKLELADCNGVITSSKDNKIKVWSLGLDLWGNLNGNTDMDDLKWKIPTKQIDLNREKELASLEYLIDNLKLDLKGNRLKLIINETALVKEKEEKTMTRINWFQMQRDREEREREMALKQKKVKREQEIKLEKGEIIVQKIDKAINDHDLSMKLLMLEAPKAYKNKYTTVLADKIGAI